VNIRQNEGLREKLSSEYVLGTLKGGARRRFESWLKDDASLRRSVAEWQDRLVPLAELTVPVTPSPQLWRRIEAQLDKQHQESNADRSTGWFGSLSFWRGLSIGSTAIAALLVVVLLGRQPDIGIASPDSIAVLADDQARIAMVVKGDVKRRQLIVKVVAPQNIGPDKSLELWALPKEGAPRSLGLVAANQEVVLALPPNTNPQSIPTLAVSLEPKGGSPNPNAPTGPVLFKGSWVQI
jgi:anti-sigma-K factor RskA